MTGKSKLVIITLALFLAAFSLPANAEDVDYDGLDEAALPMAAQTTQAQASDQFIKIYRQVLVFDENQYGGSYNLDMLEASLAAGAAVYVYDESSGTSDYKWSIAQLGALSLDILGYGAGTEKNASLTGLFGSLGRAWNRYWSSEKKAWGYIWWCVFHSPAAGVMAEVAQWAQIVAGIAALFPGAGEIVGALIMKALFWAGTFLAVLCILIGTYAFYKSLFFGSTIHLMLRSSRKGLQPHPGSPSETKR